MNKRTEYSLEYWCEEYKQNYRDWQGEIIALQDDLYHELTASLQNKLLLEWKDIYRVVVQVVVKKTSLSLGLLTVSCCYSLAKILYEKYYPAR